MAISVVMPALEMAQDTGKVVAWRKQVGERVAKGETLLAIETDKAVVEIESPGDGILSAVSAREGAVVPVGQTIGWLLQPGEHAPAESSKSREQSGRRSATDALETAAAISGDNETIAAAANPPSAAPSGPTESVDAAAAIAGDNQAIADAAAATLTTNQRPAEPAPPDRQDRS